VEEIAVVEVGLQEGTRNDGSTWSRWTIKDGNGRTFSTFNEDYAAKLKQGSRALIEFEEKTLTPGRDGSPRKVKNITAVEATGNVTGPEPGYSQQKPTGERDEDKVALGKTRCLLWAELLSGLSSSLYAQHKGDLGSFIRASVVLVAAAEKDIFERPAGDDGFPFNEDE
jgi:hypothetical protein